MRKRTATRVSPAITSPQHTTHVNLFIFIYIYLCVVCYIRKVCPLVCGRGKKRSDPWLVWSESTPPGRRTENEEDKEDEEDLRRSAIYPAHGDVYRRLAHHTTMGGRSKS